MEEIWHRTLQALKKFNSIVITFCDHICLLVYHHLYIALWNTAECFITIVRNTPVVLYVPGHNELNMYNAIQIAIIWNQPPPILVTTQHSKSLSIDICGNWHTSDHIEPIHSDYLWCQHSQTSTVLKTLYLKHRAMLERQSRDLKKCRPHLRALRFFVLQ